MILRIVAFSCRFAHPGPIRAASGASGVNPCAAKAFGVFKTLFGAGAKFAASTVQASRWSATSGPMIATEKSQVETLLRATKLGRVPVLVAVGAFLRAEPCQGVAGERPTLQKTP